MNAKLLKEPAFLDQPARAFTKTKVPLEGDPPPRPDLIQKADDVAERSVAKNKKDADYSSAYGDKTVSDVVQHGDVWQEQVRVTSGYTGRITSVKPGKGGTTIVSVKDDVSGKLQRYVIEEGAELDPKIVKNGRIEKDAPIALERPRDYRWVEIRYSDGKPPITRAEIKSNKDGVHGWVQRGKESNERGAIAEADAMKEADEVLAVAKKKGDIVDAARLPNKIGGGGFDDVIVEFTQSGDELKATIRIREIKDYPNRHVPRAEFTAIDDNWDKNLKRLKSDVDKAVAGNPPKGFDLPEDQLDAIKRALDADEFVVEIRLGTTTRLGDPTHHAAETIKALEARVGRKIDVRKIGAGDRGP
jgi:hypothetical protein